MVDLAENLALVAARLNEGARTAMCDLLADPLKAEVEDQARRVDPDSEDLEEYQHQLLSGFAAPVREVEREEW